MLQLRIHPVEVEEQSMSQYRTLQDSNEGRLMYLSGTQRGAVDLAVTRTVSPIFEERVFCEAMRSFILASADGEPASRCPGCPGSAQRCDPVSGPCR